MKRIFSTNCGSPLVKLVFAWFLRLKYNWPKFRLLIIEDNLRLYNYVENLCLPIIMQLKFNDDEFLIPIFNKENKHIFVLRYILLLFYSLNCHYLTKKQFSKKIFLKDAKSMNDLCPLTALPTKIQVIKMLFIASNRV